MADFDGNDKNTKMQGKTQQLFDELHKMDNKTGITQGKKKSWK
jgi:hypothetical protein